MSPRTSDKPPAVSLNLDALEREGGTPEPFVVVINRHPYRFSDPQELDWQDILALAEQANQVTSMAAQVLAVLPEQDRARFKAEKIPAWKLEALFKGYLEHYGLPVPGESDASSAS